MIREILSIHLECGDESGWCECVWVCHTSVHGAPLIAHISHLKGFICAEPLLQTLLLWLQPVRTADIMMDTVAMATSGSVVGNMIIHEQGIWHVMATRKVLDLWKTLSIAGHLQAFVVSTHQAVDKETRCCNQGWPELTIAVHWISLNKRIQYTSSCFSAAEHRVACSARIATEFNCTINIIMNL